MDVSRGQRTQYKDSSGGIIHAIPHMQSFDHGTYVGVVERSTVLNGDFLDK